MNKKNYPCILQYTVYFGCCSFRMKTEDRKQNKVSTSEKNFWI